jgi:hypothetical protein
VSRADAGAPGVRAALRAAVVDFYYHSIRFVPANTAWGAGVVLLLAVAMFASPLVALACSPLLAIPLAGVARLAALVARGHDVVLSDAWAAWRSHGPRALAVGVLFVVGAVVLVTNLLTGLRGGGPLGWSIATLAGWGIVGLWVAAFPLWVLLADPARDAWSMGDRLRLVGVLVLAEPGRLVLLAVASLVVFAISAVLFAALLTVSLGYVLLVSARTVLPAADRLASRRANRFPALAAPGDAAATPGRATG